MHNVKRFLSLFLALFLVFSISIVPVYAVEVGGGTNTEITQPEEEEKESSWFASFREKLQGWFDNLGSSISNLNTTLNNSISNLKLAMSGWFDNLSSSIGGFFSDLKTSMSTWFTNLKKSVTDMSESIGGWFSDLGDDLKGWFINLKKSITDFSATVSNWFDNFFSDFGEEVKSWFIPSDDYFSNKYDEFVSKFPIIGTLVAFADELGDYINSTGEPPKISVDLGKAESKYNYGSSAVGIDFSWYARYKPTVDNFLSVVIWFFYLFFLWQHLPDVISGAGTIHNTYTSYSKTISEKEVMNSTKINNSGGGNK